MSFRAKEGARKRQTLQPAAKGLVIIIKVLKSRMLFRVCLGVFILCCLPLAALAVFAVKGFLPINPVPALIAFAGALASGFLLVIAFFARRGFRRLTCVSAVASLALTAAFLYYAIPFSVIFQPNEIEYFTSPDGRGVVVFNQGFIDAAYSAHQVKWGLFYRMNDASVTRHDFWGGAEKEIVWEQDRAVVYILFDGYTRDEGDSIEVKLD